MENAAKRRHFPFQDEEKCKIIWWNKKKCVSLQRQEEILDYPVNVFGLKRRRFREGQALIDTTHLKRVANWQLF